MSSNKTFEIPKKVGNYLPADCECVFDYENSDELPAFKRMGEITTGMVSRMLGGLRADDVPNKGFVALWSDDDGVLGVYRADSNWMLVKVSFEDLVFIIRNYDRSFSERLVKIAGL